MTDDRWEEVDRLFRRALDRPPGERAAFLAEACGDDPELAAAVRDLLEATDEADPFLETPIEDLWDAPWDEILPDRDAGAPSATDPRFDRSGDRLGPWRLLRRVGRGGMATVYLAERADGQWEQRVAVKILRRGLDTEDVVRRFLAERQILSSLDHPNIARLLDGGSTPDGLPYFVMEHVEGTPIDAYCDARRLAVDERLDLFCAVGRAVQGAHRHLVVHRDLKPSNILVDDRGRPRLLDFGIAKIVDPGDPDDDPTRTGARPLTLPYASPEQMAGAPVTTASDVYQLGLLLCELLAGRRPYEVRALSPARAERAVLEADPRRPSALVDDEAARARSTGRGDLVRRLRDDLDTIVLRALRKDPEERYGSAAALVDDIERHRRGEPVLARPTTPGYRARKFVARHRKGVLAAAVALALLVGSAAVAWVQAGRAERERNLARAEAAKAEEVKDVLVGLFRSADPYAPADPERGRHITVVEALELGVDRARIELADRPAILGEVLASISDVYERLGQTDRATPVAEDALEALVRAHGDASGEVAGVLWSLGNLAADRDDRESARAHFDRALSAAISAWGPDDPRVARFHSAIGTFLWQSNLAALDSARVHQRRAVDLLRAGGASHEGDLAQALYKLANIHRMGGSLEAARRALDEALPLSRRVHGSDHPYTAFVLVSEAALRTEEGHPEAARAAYLEALKILETALGEEHNFVLTTWNNYALMLANTGRLEEAETVYRRLVEARRRVLGENHSDTAGTIQNLAVNLNGQGRYDEAETLLGRASEAFRASLGPDHPRAAFPLLTQTEIRLNRGDWAGAERSAREATGILRGALPEEHWLTAVAECRLGRALDAQGRAGEAQPLIEDALETLEANAVAAKKRRVEECRAAREALVADE